MSNYFYVPESAMAIVAHPDDIDFSAINEELIKFVTSGMEEV